MDLLPDRPPRAGLVLATLVTGAVVANINLSIANVALPDIGRQLGASQEQQTMVASMFTMGLAATVLYLGAIGDRYGRKLLLLCGAALSVPASLIAGLAPNVEVLIGARLLGGVAAGLLFPTTLSLISALWRGRALTTAISIWSGVGGMCAALGGIVGGVLLEHYWWGSVFVITAPFAVLVFAVGLVVVPWHAGEHRVPVDHFGGVLSVLGIALLIVAIQRLPDGFTAGIGIELAIAAALLVIFFLWQRRARRPLIDLTAASAPTFWVAATAGTITFGALIGAMFIGQQFTQNVLGFSALDAGLAVLPAPVCMLAASIAAGKSIEGRGSRLTMAAGIIVLGSGFLMMLVFWRPGAATWAVLLPYALTGTGVGLAATTSSHSLMASLTVDRAGMGSAFTDLTRDFGGAIMQAAMGTILAIVYSDYLMSAFSHLPPEQAAQVSDETAQKIVGSFQGAEQVAAGLPPDQAQKLIEAASAGFTAGKGLAYALGVVLAILSFALVVWKYPRRGEERAYFAGIERIDREEAAAC